MRVYLKKPLARRKLALDATPQDLEALVSFLTNRLNSADLRKVKNLLGMEDDEESSRPRVGTSDAAPIAYDEKTFPHSGRLKGSY